MQRVTTYINNGAHNKKTAVWFKWLTKVYVNVSHPKRLQYVFECAGNENTLGNIDDWLQKGSLYLLTKEEAIQIYNEINKDNAIN